MHGEIKRLLTTVWKRLQPHDIIRGSRDFNNRSYHLCFFTRTWNLEISVSTPMAENPVQYESHKHPWKKKLLVQNQYSVHRSEGHL